MRISFDFIFFISFLIPFFSVPFYILLKEDRLFLKLKKSIWTEFSHNKTPPSNEDVIRLKSAIDDAEEKLSSSLQARVVIAICMFLPLVLSFYNYQTTLFCGGDPCSLTGHLSNYAAISTAFTSFCFALLFAAGLIPSIKRFMQIENMKETYFLASSDDEWSFMLGNSEAKKYFDKIVLSGRRPFVIELYVASEIYQKNNT